MVDNAIGSNAITNDSVCTFGPARAGIGVLTRGFNVGSYGDKMRITSVYSCVILSIGPGILTNILGRVTNGITNGNGILVSVTTNGSVSFVTRGLGDSRGVIHVVPGVGTIISRSYDTCYTGSLISRGRGTRIRGLFSTINAVARVSRDVFPLFKIVNNYSPTFICVFVSTLTETKIRRKVGGRLTLGFTTRDILNDTGAILRDGRRPFRLVSGIYSPNKAAVRNIISLRTSNFRSTIRGTIGGTIRGSGVLWCGGTVRSWGVGGSFRGAREDFYFEARLFLRSFCWEV